MGQNYRVEVLKAEEDEGFVLHCPELKGCITYSDTLAHGFEMIEDAKKCWFTACIEDGIPIPEPDDYVDFYGMYVKLPEQSKKKARLYVSELLKAANG